MKTLDAYALGELKLIYRLLHAQLPDYPDLMDSELLQELQAHLQQMARAQGVDVSLHAQWTAWLSSGD